MHVVIIYHEDVLDATIQVEAWSSPVKRGCYPKHWVTGVNLAKTNLTQWYVIVLYVSVSGNGLFTNIQNVTILFVAKTWK